MSAEGFCTVEEALAELRAGRMIVLVDDEYRENEGDLVMAAEKITPESVNFMLSQARGVLRVGGAGGRSAAGIEYLFHSVNRGQICFRSMPETEPNCDPGLFVVQ